MLTIYTIGHSTRSITDFIDLLAAFDIAQLVDIRTIPKSRHNPQFMQDELQVSLPQAGIDYVYLKILGGLRSGMKNSPNTGWRNLSFRSYADYMQTEQFAHGIDELIELAQQKRTAIMCAEAVPWRCHRSLVADALLVRGIQVLDIINSHQANPESLTSFAKVAGTTITYPPLQEPLWDTEGSN